MSKFAHLHVHTEYSLLDGLSKIKKLLVKVKDLGMDSVAITDHGTMYGAIEFYKEARKQNVNPIIGMEGYITNIPISDKDKRSKSKNYHILLLAKNNEGYKNLMKLTSTAHLEGYYYKPRVDWEVLKKYSKGLICTSSCPQGQVGQALIQNDYEKAKNIAEWHLDVFGDDYYLEIQKHNYKGILKNINDPVLKNMLSEVAESEKKYFDGTVKLSRDLGIPLVATNDSHYIEKEEAPVQDALVCISTGKKVDDIKRLRYIDNPDFYIKTPDEMHDLYKDYPDAVENTVKIAKKCNVEIKLGDWFFPKFKLPANTSADKVLRDLAHKKMEEKIPENGKIEKERLDYELDIICNKGYAPYFLIVRDLANWTAKQGIITNTRGSAAGSLVSYVLGITTVNPIEYLLPFERFLNPFRPSPPDIDFDVADNRREEIIHYFADTYGHDKVAQICTFGRMLSRGSVRDVARVLGYEYAVGDRISKLIPPPKQGFPITIPKALEEVSELQSFYKSDKDAKKILDLSKAIEGNARHLSVHAAGVVVSPTEITDFTPIQREPSGEKVITQYEMHACEDVGLIKFDILGIRNLSIMGSAIEIIKKERGIKVDISSIPFDDIKTYEMLSRGETMGTFQLGGSGMTKFLMDLKPERVDDLMAMVALYRPGPLSQIPEYIKRKNNPKLVKYLDPRMKKFLDRSYGLIVYQDDLLFCAIDLAGYTWEEADKFRKAVGKKIPEEMAAQKEKFVKGIIDNGQSKDFADELWMLFEPFQSYGFNKAHAASYGIVAYQTSYLKANFPVEYMTALLSAESSDSDKIAQALAECRRMKIKVLGPDINESSYDFTIVKYDDSHDEKAIRFGLNAVKNVGKAAVEAILTARNEEKFVSIVDFFTRVEGRKVNKKVIESLIKVGAMSKFGSRQLLLNNLDEIRGKIIKNSDKNKNQQSLFTADDYQKNESEVELSYLNLESEEYDDEEIEKFEKELMGFSLSEKPVEELISDISALATHKISDITDFSIKNEMKLAVVVSDVRIIVTRTSGKEMAFLKVKDETGSIDMIVFPKIFDEVKNLLLSDKTFLVTGKPDGKEEKNTIIVESLVSSKNVSENGGHYYINIPKNATAKDLSEVKTILTANPGNHFVSLTFENNRNKNIKLPFKINWSKELSEEIQNIFNKKEVLD